MAATLQAQLIVGADGRESLVRKLAAIGTQGWDYDQHAIVATIRPQRHHRVHRLATFHADRSAGLAADTGWPLFHRLVDLATAGAEVDGAG